MSGFAVLYYNKVLKENNLFHRKTNAKPPLRTYSTHANNQGVGASIRVIRVAKHKKAYTSCKTLSASKGSNSVVKKI